MHTGCAGVRSEGVQGCVCRGCDCLPFLLASVRIGNRDDQHYLRTVEGSRSPVRVVLSPPLNAPP